MLVSKGCEIRKQLSVTAGNSNPVGNIFGSGNVAGKGAFTFEYGRH